MDTAHVESKRTMIRNVCVKNLENKRVENVIVDYILKSNDERIVINDFIQGEPLADENLDDVLNLVTEINKRYNFQKVDSANPCKMGVSEVENANEIRLLFPNKSIWIYSGYTWESIVYSRMPHPPKHSPEEFLHWNQRMEIVSKCDVLVDGQYIDSQRDITLRWKGSKNQRVIDCKKSLEQNKVVLYYD